MDKFTASVTITVTGGNAEYSAGNVMYLPSGVTSIEEAAFEGTAADTVILNNDCKYVGPRAFADSKVKTVYVPEGVNYAADAFDSDVRILDGSKLDRWMEHTYVMTDCITDFKIAGEVSLTFRRDGSYTLSICGSKYDYPREYSDIYGMLVSACGFAGFQSLTGGSASMPLCFRPLGTSALKQIVRVFCCLCVCMEY